MPVTYLHWLLFNTAIIVILCFDLWRFYRRPHVIELKEALLVSAGWILVALAFNLWIYLSFGSDHALNFFTGYLLEKALSVDNLFLFLLIFTHFKVPEISQHKVLFYGVLGAIVMRALLIWGGIALVQHFDWVFMVFGPFLIFTGFYLAFKQEKEDQIEQGFFYRWMMKTIKYTPNYHGEAFFVLEKGQWLATPLLIVLILIEFTDLVFALDSVPAILGITTEPFIVFTSNIFAILGLRSLFFALQGMMKRLHLLHYALAAILVFIGIKMTLSNWFHIPNWVTLALLVLLLTTSIVGSLYSSEKKSSE
jgi:tellurite resistance protein TerC